VIELSDQPPDLWLARATWLWRTFVRRPALFWTNGVNYRIGSWIASTVFETPISPNWLTVAGLVVHAAGAMLVLTQQPTVLVIAAAAVIWQIAFGFDCADGLLARGRRQTSEYGAWLDQVIDFMSHVLVFGSLATVVVERIGLESTVAALFAVWVVSANCIQGYAVGVKAASGVVGLRLTSTRGGAAGVAAKALQLTDYGFVLFVASSFLALPTLLGVYLTLNGLLSVGSVVVQLMLYGRRQPT